MRIAAIFLLSLVLLLQHAHAQQDRELIGTLACRGQGGEPYNPLQRKNTCKHQTPIYVGGYTCVPAEEVRRLPTANYFSSAGWLGETYTTSNHPHWLEILSWEPRISLFHGLLTPGMCTAHEARQGAWQACTAECQAQLHGRPAPARMMVLLHANC